MGSLRYRRPYWMLRLSNVKYWRVYNKTAPGFHRTELLYQAWLGGLDRPYARPKCTHRTPTWLTKKRFALEPSHLTPETAAERFFLDFRLKFYDYRGTMRPTAMELNDVLDLVERPLDMSYACRVLSALHNDFVVRLEQDAFQVFVDACSRVDRKDLMQYALENAEKLGFWHIDADCKKYIEGTQSWYKIVDGRCLPLDENAENNTKEKVAERLTSEASHLSQQIAAAVEETADATTTTTTTTGSTTLDEDEEELKRLEEELKRLGGDDES
eukprot:PhM_4_TR6235/c1_g1_i1/m.22549